MLIECATLVKSIASDKSRVLTCAQLTVRQYSNAGSLFLWHACREGIQTSDNQISREAIEDPIYLYEKGRYHVASHQSLLPGHNEQQANDERKKNQRWRERFFAFFESLFSLIFMRSPIWGVRRWLAPRAAAKLLDQLVSVNSFPRILGWQRRILLPPPLPAYLSRDLHTLK